MNNYCNKGFVSKTLLFGALAILGTVILTGNAFAWGFKGWKNKDKNVSEEINTVENLIENCKFEDLKNCKEWLKDLDWKNIKKFKPKDFNLNKILDGKCKNECTIVDTNDILEKYGFTILTILSDGKIDGKELKELSEKIGKNSDGCVQCAHNVIIDKADECIEPIKRCCSAIAGCKAE